MKNIYLAPMEGVTTSIYRRVLNKYYPGIFKFFTPFISPNQTKTFQARELDEMDTEKNAGMNTCIQLMTNNQEHFLFAAREIIKRGYGEVNLNLGCPMPQVVTKKKGSGFLKDTDALEQFLYEIFAAGLKLNISVKTRLGVDSPDEFYEILDIYNKFKFSEVILHARIQKDLYKGSVRTEWFDYAYENSKNTLVFNGDMREISDIDGISLKYPLNPAVMLGRGIIARPYILCDGDVLRDKERFKSFNDELLYEYSARIGGDFNVLCKLKELWFYMLPCLDVSKDFDKKIRKVSRVADYKMLVHEIIDSVRN